MDPLRRAVGYEPARRDLLLRGRPEQRRQRPIGRDAANTATPHAGRHSRHHPQPYPGYPGFYYTVQFYPVNATGAEAHVIVTVGYGTDRRFRVQEFEGVYTPQSY